MVFFFVARSIPSDRASWSSSYAGLIVSVSVSSSFEQATLAALRAQIFEIVLDRGAMQPVSLAVHVNSTRLWSLNRVTSLSPRLWSFEAAHGRSAQVIQIEF